MIYFAYNLPIIHIVFHMLWLECYWNRCKICGDFIFLFEVIWKKNMGKIWRGIWRFFQQTPESGMFTDVGPSIELQALDWLVGVHQPFWMALFHPMSGDLNHSFTETAKETHLTLFSNHVASSWPWTTLGARSSADTATLNVIDESIDESINQCKFVIDQVRVLHKSGGGTWNFGDYMSLHTRSRNHWTLSS